jgi:glycosyltransferase involved in cell wall biosynthesis
MMHLFLNCLAASSGSGLTYVRNVIPQFSTRPELQVSVALAPKLRTGLPSSDNISFLEMDLPSNAAARFCWEQSQLPRMIQKSGADVLISAGNFALWRAPVPQILLSGNSLYTSADFRRDLRARGAYRIWLDTLVRGFFARRSVRWADCTVAPSNAFANTLQRWTGSKVVGLHHGFNPEVFFREGARLPSAIQEKINSGKKPLRLIFVSHYNYYRNFETLLRALPYIQERLGGRHVQLLLTCKLSDEEDSGLYRTDAAAGLIKHLEISDQVVELGSVPYHLLQHVLRACDIYVSPAYAETFAHPLVEAMACGLPVVASDLPVHREICGDAAVYFPRFSPQVLADRVVQLEKSFALRKKLSERALERSHGFSWRAHVDQVIALAHSLKLADLAYPHAA